jgi:hypothetical protein
LPAAGADHERGGEANVKEEVMTVVESMESVVEKSRPGEIGTGAQCADMRAIGGESTAAEPSRASTNPRACKMATDHAVSSATADHRVSRASTHAARAGISHSGSSAKGSCSCKYDDCLAHHFLLMFSITTIG